jgi:hypothetical protein
MLGASFRRDALNCVSPRVITVDRVFTRRDVTRRLLLTLLTLHYCAVVGARAGTPIATSGFPFTCESRSDQLAEVAPPVLSWSSESKTFNNSEIRMKNHLLTIASLSLVLALASVSTAHAALGSSWVRYSIDGGATWTEIQDNAAGDTSAADGVINYGFSAGGYAISIVGTITKPFGGITPATPFMDLVVGGVAGAGSAGLIVEFTDIGWTPVPTGSFASKMAVNDSGALTAGLNTRAGANVRFAPVGFSLASIAPLSGLATGSQTTPVPLGLTAPYSLTLSTVFANNGTFGTISTDASIEAVPEGGSTLVLLGIALSFMAFFARCRKASA